MNASFCKNYNFVFDNNQIAFVANICEKIKIIKQNYSLILFLNLKLKYTLRHDETWEDMIHEIGVVNSVIKNLMKIFCT